VDGILCLKSFYYNDYENYNFADNIHQRAEIYITNYNTDEFLSSVVLDAFGDIILRVFENNAAHITQVIHPALRGIAIPPAPLKHGLVIYCIETQGFLTIRKGPIKTLPAICPCTSRKSGKVGSGCVSHTGLQYIAMFTLGYRKNSVGTGAKFCHSWH